VWSLTKQQRALVAVFPLVTVFAIYLFAFEDSGARRMKARCEQIKPGMTIAEVERVLGSPPSVRPGSPGDAKRFAASVGRERACWYAGIWESPDRRSAIHVFADLDGKVSRATFSSEP
jgi:hypothetical protein